MGDGFWTVFFIDIATKVSMLSSYLAYLHEGCLETALHATGYLRLKHNLRLVFNPAYPEIDLTAFPTFDWTESYGYVEEAIPPNIPPPLGKDVNICMKVDSDMRETNRLDTPVLDS